MQYKIYSYEISDKNRNKIAPDRHYDLFRTSVGRDASGTFATYRGRNDAVLMEIRRFGSDFSGLVGRHATEREVTKYDQYKDEAIVTIEDDDDYPHTSFLCFPRLGFIACIDGTIKADAALSRIHVIIAHRHSLFFTFESNKQPVDLRVAVRRFRVVEVNFEILPVNPHTGPLGLALDADRAKDHIRKLKGKAEGTKANPIKLNGGLLTAVQELQQSGHARLGFRGITESGAEVVVPKPPKAKELEENEDDSASRDEIDIKVNFPNVKATYPPTQGHVTDMRKIIRDLNSDDNET